MLTAQQKAMRRTGVTASESAAILRWHPYKTATQIWLSKPTPSRPPLLDAEDSDEETPRQQVGTFLEAGIRELVHARTGLKFRRATTLRHREIPHLLGTPDGLSAKAEDAGLEIKLVGERMAHHWEGESIPDYVTSQALVGMAVSGRSRWIVAALIGGTDLRIHSIERDEDLEGAVVDACDQFWIDNVLGDEPPEPESTEERRLYLRTRYPGSEATACVHVERDEVAETMRWLATARDMRMHLEQAEDALKAMLCGAVGDAYGIETAAGKFIWYPRRGDVDWQALAEELAVGAVPADVIERHRRPGYRVPKFSPPKPKTNGKRLPR